MYRTIAIAPAIVVVWFAAYHSAMEFGTAVMISVALAIVWIGPLRFLRLLAGVLALIGALG